MPIYHLVSKEGNWSGRMITLGETPLEIYQSGHIDRLEVLVVSWNLHHHFHQLLMIWDAWTMHNVHSRE